jgi:hypothetical protein
MGSMHCILLNYFDINGIRKTDRQLQLHT